jgi:hypothetical protein
MTERLNEGTVGVGGKIEDTELPRWCVESVSAGRAEEQGWIARGVDAIPVAPERGRRQWD